MPETRHSTGENLDLIEDKREACGRDANAERPRKGKGGHEHTRKHEAADNSGIDNRREDQPATRF